VVGRGGWAVVGRWLGGGWALLGGIILFIENKIILLYMTSHNFKRFFLFL
jgi:hypothetical protein